MEMSKSRPERCRKEKSDPGFTMIEVLVAIVVLCTGMVALSSVAAQALSGTARSGFVGIVSDLASEKLEDLNRWPQASANICGPSGGTEGSLTSDIQVATVTCGGTALTGPINYFDDVNVNNSSGAVCETVSSIIAGVQQYTTTCHQPSGLVSTSTSASASASDPGTTAYHRRWTIEEDQPIPGVRRMTVLVMMQNSFVNPPVSYQMSMVRP
jgi:prepilin-type N-terminal cleavage/methylation domain-containing protein